MNRDFVVYDMTGRIVRFGSVQESELDRVASGPGESYLEGIGDQRTQYIVGGVITARPTFNVSFDNGTVAEGGTVTISNIPVGTVARVEGETMVVNDGTLAITLPYAGTYRVILQNFPNQDWEQVFICN